MKRESDGIEKQERKKENSLAIGEAVYPADQERPMIPRPMQPVS
jgi:hypothetical protein